MQQLFDYGVREPAAYRSSEACPSARVPTVSLMPLAPRRGRLVPTCKRATQSHRIVFANGSLLMCARTGIWFSRHAKVERLSVTGIAEEDAGDCGELEG